MSQVVRHQLFSAMARVISQANLCGIYGEQRCTRMRSSPSTSRFPCQYSSSNASSSKKDERANPGGISNTMWRTLGNSGASLFSLSYSIEIYDTIVTKWPSGLEVLLQEMLENFVCRQVTLNEGDVISFFRQVKSRLLRPSPAHLSVMVLLPPILPPHWHW